MRKALVMLVVLVPSLGLAQQAKIEIMPTLGYRWGGDVRIESRGLAILEPDGSTVINKDFDTGVSSEGSFGLRLGLSLNPQLQLELMANFQQTQFKDTQALFGEVPGGFLPPNTTNFLDVTVQYYHAGLVYYLSEGESRWYILGSLGVTAIDPHMPLPNETAFSGSVGGGWRMEISDALALRVEGRYYYTPTDTNSTAVFEYGNRDCVEPCSYTYRYNDNLPQTELSFGLVIKL